jgi:hypothetical protein
MIASGFTLELSQLPAEKTAWHLCTVFIPRRAITGRLVRGQVWRRHDAVTGYTKNSSFRGWHRERLAAARDARTVEPTASRWWQRGRVIP